MRITSTFAALITAVALALMPSAALASAPKPAPTPASPIKATERFVAVPMIKGAKPAEEPPVFECQWGWNGSVGGFYPEAWLKYVATFECGEDYGVGPDMSGTIRGSLHDSPGGLIRHTGPDEAFTFCCGLDLSYVESGGEITLTGPGQKFYINNDSIIDLLPNPADNIVWIWSYLPAGCEGVGSPRAVCNLNSGEWAIN